MIPSQPSSPAHKCHCGEPATHAYCYPAEPWRPSCKVHLPFDAMSVIGIDRLKAVNRYVPKMFGGTYEQS